jgi:hypothetical protein
LADLYFARWPLQENWFKEGDAVGLADRNRSRPDCLIQGAAPRHNMFACLHDPERGLTFAHCGT